MSHTEEEITRETEGTEEPCCVVGIGASAGGLEALQDFFKAMPADTGAAFVVVQHLSPDHKSLMAELLSRCTTMTVKAAQDGQAVLPDHVYLIPPGKDLSIYQGKLYLQGQNSKNHINLAIDSFFRSLAADKRKHAIAVVLSGAGSDGTLGIRAVKEAGGMVMVQDVETAKFDSMPQSSIATGLVDFVLPPAKMAEALVEFLKHPYITNQARINPEIGEGKALSKILATLRTTSGIDFSSYKENTILRRLERRISVKHLASLEEYLHCFLDSEEEQNTLYKELLIGVTSFFRDEEAFEYIRKNVLPELNPREGVLRVWSAACSTGEEAYSLAMLVAEYIREKKLTWEVKIFATDIDKNALSVAAQGYYPDSVVSDVDQELLSRYFIKGDGGYRVNAELRKMLIFSEHNVLCNPPFSRLDLITCRNLFIYLKPETQQDLLQLYYYALNPGGYLFMGTSESVGEMSGAFQVVNNRWKIYQRSESYTPLLQNGVIVGGRVRSSTSYKNTRGFGGDTMRLERIIEQAFSVAMPPSVIVDEMDNILHMANEINQILVFHAGRFTNNLFSNLPNDVGLVVNGLLRRLRNGSDFSSIRATGLEGFQNREVLIKGYHFIVRQSHFYLLSFLAEERTEEGEAIVSTVLDGQSELSRRCRELEQELQLAKESLQATVEELETSNEELQSSNEELVAANEELQSTNEELQSVNEELYTVNSEYQTKIHELVSLNSDLDNLLKNTDVGALYLDNDLKIRKVTPRVSEITNIREVDVGRPISHLALMEGYPEWYEDISYVRETLYPVEREIGDDSGRYWIVRVRPYRTAYRAVEGVIMTFVEITGFHKREEQAE
ncbi:chemotaxis protein CheB [Hungatella sp.]|uniref:chemotaxis protein CheB n=1 Tax=Hungatella sp. TaxID=2613924 RepID=UPI002A81FC07|nr:chemotaxis protein CheB [Hungatella sp.]